ncbi:hypothetical protein GCM10010193_24040 [Kitasatospora atroaurantiaca]
MTVVQNAIDTAALDEAHRKMTERQIIEVQAEYGLTLGRTGLFSGPERPQAHPVPEAGRHLRWIATTSSGSGPAARRSWRHVQSCASADAGAGPVAISAPGRPRPRRVTTGRSGRTPG